MSMPDTLLFVIHINNMDENIRMIGEYADDTTFGGVMDSADSYQD